MSLIDSARQVLERKQFVTIDVTTGDIVPTPDAVYGRTEFDEILDTPEAETPANVTLLDAFTASLLTQVYDALSEEGRAKFDSLSPLRCVDICWKIANKERT